MRAMKGFREFQILMNIRVEWKGGWKGSECESWKEEGSKCKSYEMSERS